MKKVIIIVLLTAFSFSSKSQNSEIFLGTNFPLFYTIGLEQNINNNFSLNVQLGILTKPYDKLIVNLLYKFDEDELLFNTIGEAFSYGFNFQPIFKWNFRKSYIGLSYSYLILTATDSPSDVIENYYGITLSLRRNNNVTLKSNLHSSGLLYGRKFYLKNPKLRINIEFSLLKTFASNTYIKNESGIEFEKLNASLNNDFEEIYLQYAFYPSINIYLVYIF